MYVPETEFESHQGSVDRYKLGQLTVARDADTRVISLIMRGDNAEQRSEMVALLSRITKIKTNQDCIVKVLQAKHETCDKLKQPMYASITSATVEK